MKKHRIWLVFAALCLGYISLALINRNYILTDDIVYESLSKQLSSERVEDIMASRAESNFLPYLLTPVFRLINVAIISLIVLIGVYLHSYEIKYRQIFRVVVIASIVFLIPGIWRTIVFAMKTPNFTLEEFREFSPHSILYYLDRDSIKDWFYYPLYLVNLAELIFMFVVAVGLKKAGNLKLTKSILLVIETYFVSLVLWTLFVVFLSINAS